MSFSMKIQYTVEQIPAEELIPFDGLTDTLSSISLPESVLLSPLIVFKSPNNESFYSIIDGFKRFLSLRERKTQTVTCVVIPLISVVDAGKMRIELNSGRTILFSEKLQFLKWAKQNNSESDYREIALKLSVSGKDLRDMEQLFDAPAQLVDAALKGYLDTTLISELKFFTEEDISAVVFLFSHFPFTRQTQRELLEWIPELVYRNKKSISELYESDFIKKIIDDRKLNDPQKIKKIRDHYYELRFPTLTETKKAWSTLAASINPAPSNVSFNPSDAFEKNVLEIRIRITDALQGRSILKNLAEISEIEWESLIYPALLFSAKNEQKM
jgi:hypothetical protein